MLALSWPDVLRRRLVRNGLTESRPPTGLAALAGQVGGIQAQVLSAAELAVGARVRDLDRPGLHGQLWQQRTIVKTYGARGTLHLLPANELPLWLAAMRGTQNAQDEPWREYDVRPEQGEAIVAAIGAALDGRCLTRDELTDTVLGEVGEWARERLSSSWGYLLPPAAYAGLLCYGPSQGTKVTFVRADQWVGDWWEPSEREGLRHVLRRFVGTYGPVASRDFGRWFGLEPEHSRALFAEAADELVEVDVEGRSSWLLAEDAEEAVTGQPESVRLLPQYDCYVLGSHPRDRILPDLARERVFSYRRGRFEGVVALSVLLIDGVVAGIWERRGKGRKIDVRLEPFVRLTARHRERLAAECESIAAFLDTDVTLSVGRLD
jgi:hypothetical protein